MTCVKVIPHFPGVRCIGVKIVKCCSITKNAVKRQYRNAWNLYKLK